jgi:hypothetical protein
MKNRESKFLFSPQCNLKKRQAAYYTVTMRRVCVTIVAVEKQQVLHILCVCVCFFNNIQHAPLQSNVTCFRVK